MSAQKMYICVIARGKCQAQSSVMTKTMQCV